MKFFRKTTSLVLTAALAFSMFTVFPAQSIAAEGSGSNDVTYSLSDLALSDTDDVLPAFAAGSFGMLVGNLGDVVYHNTGSEEYVQIKALNKDANHSPSFGFLLPEGDFDRITAEYKIRLDEDMPELNEYHNYILGDNLLYAGFLNGTVPSHDNYKIRMWFNNNCQLRNDGWQSFNTSYSGQVKPAFWYSFKIVVEKTETGYAYDQYANGDYIFSGETTSDIDRFAFSFGMWGGKQELVYDIKDFTITFEEPGESGTEPESNSWALDLSDSEADSPVGMAVAGQFGAIDLTAGSLTVKEDTDGSKYIQYENPGASAPNHPSFGFTLPKAITSGMVTAEYKIRVSDTDNFNGDHYILSEFNKGGTFGDANRIAGVLFKNVGGNGEIRDRAVGSTYSVGTVFNVWHSFILEADVTNGTFTFSSNGNQLFTGDLTSNSIEQFLICEEAWGGKFPLTFDIKDVTVTLSESQATEEPEAFVPGPDPGTQGSAWTRPEGATDVWAINNQLAAYSAQNGDALPVYDANVKEAFSAYTTAPNIGGLTVKGIPDNPYIEIAYKGSYHDNNLVLELPKTYTSGTLIADYKLYLKPNSTYYWFYSGFSTNGVGIDSGTSRVIHCGPGGEGGTSYISINAAPGEGGWKTIKTFQPGGWWRYVMTVDVGMQIMSLDVYGPNDTKPTSYSYPIDGAGTKAVSQFVIQPYSNQGGHEGILCVKDVAISYVPAEKTPVLFSPVHDSFMVTTTPTFKWSSTGADSYTLEYSTSADFTTGVTTIQNISRSSYALTAPLEYGTNYYWRVTSVYTDEEDQVSSVFHLFTEIEPSDVYYAGDYGLIEGNWDEWPVDTNIGNTNIPRYNANVIQGLLDLAGRNGGGTVILPEGIYCLAGDTSIRGKATIEFRYDNLTLTGQGKDDDGNYKTVLKTSYQWDGPNGLFRSTGMRVMGTPFNSSKARQNIEISHFEMDGGRGHSGRYDWGYDPAFDYGWDIGHQGIALSNDNQVTHVTLDDVYVHSYSGETLYVGGMSVGYLEVKNCTLADTNASCFNLYAAYLNVHDNQFGSVDGDCRFWIEYCNRPSNIGSYESSMPAIPAGIEKDTAYFRNNKFYNVMGAEGIVLCQGDCREYTMYFENNEFDNSRDTNKKGMFMFGGAVYGPIYIRNNTFNNVDGYIIDFSFGGGTQNEQQQNEDWLKDKNIYFEDNTCTNIGGPFINLQGSWGRWDSDLNAAVPAVRYAENLFIRNNTFVGKNNDSKSIAIGSYYNNIESAMHLTNVTVEGNTFENCTAPEEVREFLGNVPLFKDNVYENVKATAFGGIANLTAAEKLIKPVYETLTLNASTPITAEMRTGRNENGQMVTLVGGNSTSAITFVPSAESYNVPETIILRVGDELLMKYNAASSIWEYQLYTPSDPVQKITITSVNNGNRQADVNFLINSANGKGYTVYLSETGNVGSFKVYSDVNYNSKGAHIKGLTNGRTYYVYVEYADKSEISRSNVVILKPSK